MRMKQVRVKTYKVCPKIVTKDSEGVPSVTYGGGHEVKGEAWPATDRLQAQTYGDRISNIMNMRFQGKYTIRRSGRDTEYVFSDFVLKQGDGVCVYADTPDYQIISVKPYIPIRLEIERLI